MTRKQSKQWLVILLCMLVAMFCALPTYAATSRVKLSATSLKVDPGSSILLKLTGNVDRLKVQWCTSNSNVAEISDDEYVSSVYVKGNNAGTATITAKYLGKLYKCKVTVGKTYVSLKIGSKTYKSGYFKPGEELQSTLTVDKRTVKTGQLRLMNAKSTYAVYESFDPYVVSVSKTGKLTFRGTGKVRIIVHLKNKYINEDYDADYDSYILDLVVNDATPAKLNNTFVKAEKANYVKSNKKAKEVLKYLNKYNEYNKYNKKSSMILDTKLSHAAGYVLYYAGGTKAEINSWGIGANNDITVLRVVNQYKYKSNEVTWAWANGYASSSPKQIADELLSGYVGGISEKRIGLYVTPNATVMVADVKP